MSVRSEISRLMKLADYLYYRRARFASDFPAWLKLYKDRQCVCNKLQELRSDNPDTFSDCENSLFGYRFHSEQELDPIYTDQTEDAVTLKNGHVLLPGIGDVSEL